MESPISTSLPPTSRMSRLYHSTSMPLAAAASAVAPLGPAGSGSGSVLSSPPRSPMPMGTVTSSSTSSANTASITSASTSTSTSTTTKISAPPVAMSILGQAQIHQIESETEMMLQSGKSSLSSGSQMPMPTSPPHHPPTSFIPMPRTHCSSSAGISIASTSGSPPSSGAMAVAAAASASVGVGGSLGRSLSVMSKAGDAEAAECGVEAGFVVGGGGGDGAEGECEGDGKGSGVVWQSEEVVLGWEWDDGNAVYSLPALLKTPGRFPPCPPFTSNSHLNSCSHDTSSTSTSTSHSHPHPNGNSTSNPNPNSTYDPHPPQPAPSPTPRQQMTNILHALSSTVTTCASGSRAKYCALEMDAETEGAAQAQAYEEKRARAGVNGRVKPNDTPAPALLSILLSGSPTPTPASPNLRRGGKGKEKAIEGDVNVEMLDGVEDLRRRPTAVECSAAGRMGLGIRIEDDPRDIETHVHVQSQRERERELEDAMAQARQRRHQQWPPRTQRRPAPHTHSDTFAICTTIVGCLPAVVSDWHVAAELVRELVAAIAGLDLSSSRPTTTAFFIGSSNCTLTSSITTPSPGARLSILEAGIASIPPPAAPSLSQRQLQSSPDAESQTKPQLQLQLHSPEETWTPIRRVDAGLSRRSASPAISSPSHTPEPALLALSSSSTSKSRQVDGGSPVLPAQDGEDVSVEDAVTIRPAKSRSTSIASSAPRRKVDEDVEMWVEQQAEEDGHELEERGMSSPLPSPTSASSGPICLRGSSSHCCRRIFVCCFSRGRSLSASCGKYGRKRKD
ncbi:hypothetical protein GALMADRAFT_1364467 [Galerina marginata CBS 339.88]|uniref:Uncharacterized protein n=1 Tax=Galerina marginata (strain CBS 339.88) TaxID=685588 RepID=A0A067S482_GALM3|nr:hypothetical protein GALMADRAFT_1364467 [Galerina marginata CBS 339.88]